MATKATGASLDAALLALRRSIVFYHDAALRHVGPFIATMEVSEKIISSLVNSMTLAVKHATIKDVPIHCYSNEFSELSEDVIDDVELCEEVQAVRHK